MDAALTNLVRKVARYTGHPVPDPLLPDAIPTGGVFSRNDIEAFMNEYRWEAERYPLSYVISSNGAGASQVYTLVTDWATDVVLTRGSGTVVTPDTLDPENGRWRFNTPTQYPLYISGRSFDTHGAAAILLEGWAAKVKLEHDLSIGDLKLTRKQKYESLMDLAKAQRARMRIRSVRVPDDSVLGGYSDYRAMTRPPAM